eukprot:scaffold1712_cov21-Tisochrysis_lutea.AAC.1
MAPAALRAGSIKCWARTRKREMNCAGIGTSGVAFKSHEQIRKFQKKRGSSRQRGGKGQHRVLGT